MASLAASCLPLASAAPCSSASTSGEVFSGSSSCRPCFAAWRGHGGCASALRCCSSGGARAMAPDEEKMTRRSPLDFPIEWDRPAPGRRPDIFPQFSPMKTPLPQPLPADPPEEEEEEDEKKDPEEDPEKEPEKPDVPA